MPGGAFRVGWALSPPLQTRWVVVGASLAFASQEESVVRHHLTLPAGVVGASLAFASQGEELVVRRLLTLPAGVLVVSFLSLFQPVPQLLFWVCS